MGACIPLPSLFHPSSIPLPSLFWSPSLFHPSSIPLPSLFPKEGWKGNGRRLEEGCKRDGSIFNTQCSMLKTQCSRLSIGCFHPSSIPLPYLFHPSFGLHPSSSPLPSLFHHSSHHFAITVSSRFHSFPHHFSDHLSITCLITLP